MVCALAAHTPIPLPGVLGLIVFVLNGKYRMETYSIPASISRRRIFSLWLIAFTAAL
jgi:hypothetical protein